MNRRAYSRLDVEIPCRARRRGQQGPLPRVHTLNISRGGMLLLWKDDDGLLSTPVLGEELDIDLILPEPPAVQQYGHRCIRCKGEVIRVSAVDASQSRVAVRVTAMNFQHLEPGFGEESEGDLVTLGPSARR
ncbi:MAG: PilZ domain-containing protein [Acidobacteriales bacterium]|nr:PilZ domain-containing protein [Terriglobales bacterium]